jgi:putative ABC transport system permease protein
MLGQYLKLAWKVLGRRKFFTFVSLFGVGFTLMVLVVAVALLQHGLGVQAPEVHQRRTLAVHHVRMSGNNNSSGANVGERFASEFLRDLPGLERLAYYTNVGSLSSQLMSSRHAVKLTDGNYWKVLQFDFLEGRPFSDDDVRDRRQVAVITRSTADKYFGGSTGLVGKTIEVDAQRFQVVGVVADVSPLRDVGFSDIWAPISVEKGKSPRPELLGGGTALVLLQDEGAIPAAKRALAERLARWQSPDPHQYKRIQAPMDTRFEEEARDLFGEEADTVDHSGKLWAVLIGLGACFMLLPSMNLINLNVSRILERAPEIGVRKSFGATGGTLVGQFLVENLVLTLLGGAVGIGLAIWVLRLLSDSALLPHAQLRLNPGVFLAGVGLSLVFGLVSGVYPAWRMSRLQPVKALKGGER